ncbi:MAG: hypothetical protein M3R36_18405 [Bacteroidota bacterium]|nr:hypothetical protein [Bacteroidota bacterium]
MIELKLLKAGLTIRFFVQKIYKKSGTDEATRCFCLSISVLMKMDFFVILERVLKNKGERGKNKI